MQLQLEHIGQQAIALIKTVGSFILGENRKLVKEQIRFKGRNDLVTYVDTTAEKKLVAGLSQLIPDCGFITEESTTTKTTGRYRWVIDPLDGTTNYVHGLPFYSISVALMEQERVIMGIVYEITLDECFYAWTDSKAYLNGQEIKVSPVAELQDSLLATGFPYSNMSRLDSYVDLFKHLLKASQGLRRLGSAAVDLAYVACGRLDGFYEYNLNSWDVAAGSFLVETAGGKVGDFAGGKNYLFGKEIVATNANVYRPLLDAMKIYFPYQPDLGNAALKE